MLAWILNLDFAASVFASGMSSIDKPGVTSGSVARGLASGSVVRGITSSQESR